MIVFGITLFCMYLGLFGYIYKTIKSYHDLIDFVHSTRCFVFLIVLTSVLIAGYTKFPYWDCIKVQFLTALPGMAGVGAQIAYFQLKDKEAKK